MRSIRPELANRLARLFYLLLCLLCAATARGDEPSETPVQVTLCQLKSDPAAYNHKLVEVTGFVAHAHENFSLSDANCPAWPGVWLEYGGTISSGTAQCCRQAIDRHRPQELVVEDIPIPLVDDAQFEAFDHAVQPPFRPGQNDAVVHATLSGRFFSGERSEQVREGRWGGYGHMACCSMLAIQQVKDPDTHWRSDLAYLPPSDFPDIVGAGDCETPLPIAKTAEQLNAQRQAESGPRDWAFTDPRRVALDALGKVAALGKIAKSGPSSAESMRQTQASQGSYVYEWKGRGKSNSYMIVVSRPYWLSFYAHDPTRVAWVVTSAFQSTCG